MTWRLQPVGEAAFQVKNLFTAKTFCAASPTNTQSATVTQVPIPKNVNEGPAWRFKQLPDGNYKITDAKSGKALTATRNRDDYSNAITIAPWSDLDEQKWILEKIDPKQLTM